MRGETTTFEIDAALRRVASRQLGLITVEQAAKAGVDRFALARRREHGALVEEFPRVFRLASTPPSPPQRFLAASLTVPGSTIAATSAAVIHQMPIAAFATHTDAAVLVVGSTASAYRRGIISIRMATELPSDRWWTSRLATPAATLLLLPRFVHHRTVERCLDHALAHKLVTTRTVSALIDRLPSRSVKGRAYLLELLADRSEGIGHRSKLEQRVGRWLTDAGLRGWRRNHLVSMADGSSLEVDFAWVGERVALEVSPFFTHGSRATQERDAYRRRELVEHGWRVVEATDPDLEHRRAFARTILSLRHLLHA